MSCNSDQMHWDPAQYLQYGAERARPFFDLVSQVRAEPAQVVDLGCGPGDLTATLADRWPSATIRGLDSSPDMIERSMAFSSESLTFALASAEDFSAVGTDVLLSNALLQWVPGHELLLQRWAAELNTGGWLAFQVPSNFGAPSHRLMREVALSKRWRPQLGEVLRHDDAVAEPDYYLDLLASAGLRVNVWQTDYLHLLPGADPILEWMRGTGLRPILSALPTENVAEFEADYAAQLRRAYPRRPYGTIFPFLRTFVVASKP